MRYLLIFTSQGFDNFSNPTIRQEHDRKELKRHLSVLGITMNKSGKISGNEMPKG